MDYISIDKACEVLKTVKGELLNCLLKKSDTLGIPLARLSIKTGCKYEVPAYIVDAIKLEIDERIKDCLSIEELFSMRTLVVPIQSKPCVYFLFDEEELIYIGQSTNACARISAHTRDKKFNSITMLPVPKENLDYIELLYIQKYNPAINKKGLRSLFKLVFDSMNLVILDEY